MVLYMLDYAIVYIPSFFKDILSLHVCHNNIYTQTKKVYLGNGNSYIWSWNKDQNVAHN